MVVLLTGGSGYLGLAIAKYLNQNGVRIVIGSQKVSRNSQFEKNTIHKKIDWQDSKSIEDACLGVDAIIHLHGAPSYTCEKNPKYAIEVNVTHTQAILQAASKSGISKFIYISTAHIYGDSLIDVVNENTIPRPTSVYGVTHLCAEHLVMLESKIDARYIIRLSNGYGLPIDEESNGKNLVINNLCWQAIENKTIILKGSGVEKRDFISVRDVSRAMLLLLKINQKEVTKKTYNLGGGNIYSVMEIALIIQKICEKTYGYTPKIIKNCNSLVSSGLIKYEMKKIEDLGYKNVSQIEDEITSLLTHYKNAKERN